jgi:hypothetical protein
MDIMDLLYEEDTISTLFITSSDSLAASVLVFFHLGWQILTQILPIFLVFTY